MERFEILKTALESLNEITKASTATINMLNENSQSIRMIAEEIMAGEVSYKEFECDFEKLLNEAADAPIIPMPNLEPTSIEYLQDNVDLEALSDEMVELIRNEKNNPYGMKIFELKMPENLNYKKLTDMINQKLAGTYEPKKGDDDQFDFSKFIK